MRRMQILEDGGYAIEGPVELPGEGTTEFIFAHGWLLEVMENHAGEFHFISDGRALRPTSKRFGVYYPPFTFVRIFARDLQGSTTGVGSKTAIDGLPQEPCMFETDFQDSFLETAQALEIIASARHLRSIAVAPNASRLSVNTKRLIDENYLVHPSIARVAERLKVSHEHLSRQFKRDFGLSPSAYLHKLRVADATFRLSLGEEIIEISEDVGYNDLSRFYKQFRKATRTSPAACRKQVSN